MFNNVKQPKLSLNDVYNNISNINLRKHSNEISHFLDPKTKEQLYTFESNYKKFQGKNELIIPVNNVNNLSKEEARDLYTKRFSQSGCRKLLIKEFNSNFKSKNCPICESYRRSDSIDHILPKESYSQYTVTPINLVPLCQECNKQKGTKIGFNPYFEDFSKLDGLNFIVRLNVSIMKVKIEYDKSNESKKLRKLIYLYNLSGEIESDVNREFNNLLNRNYASREILEKALVALSISSEHSWVRIFFKSILNNKLSEIYSYLGI